jgi:uncharacterized membrane protein
MTEAVPFRAVITPQRSLGPRGLIWVIGILAGLAAVPTALFLALGAWPVAGFMGAEILLAVLLLRLHARTGRATEVLTLDAAGLTICRTDHRGRQMRCHLPPAWLRVDLIEHAGRVPTLLVGQRDQRIEVARELNEPDKRALADALRAAVHRQRHPSFDNPQLRDTPATR